jgi:hypothetical protein
VASTSRRVIKHPFSLLRRAHSIARRTPESGKASSDETYQRPKPNLAGLALARPCATRPSRRAKSRLI